MSKGAARNRKTISLSSPAMPLLLSSARTIGASRRSTFRASTSARLGQVQTSTAQHPPTSRHLWLGWSPARPAGSSRCRLHLQYRYCRAATHSSTQSVMQDQLGRPTDQRCIPRPTGHGVIIALKRPVLCGRNEVVPPGASAELVEEFPHVADQEIGCLHRGEVAAAVELGPMHHVVVALGEGPDGGVAGEHR